jgi:hypothetical protein
MTTNIEHAGSNGKGHDAYRQETTEDDQRIPIISGSSRIAVFRCVAWSEAEWRHLLAYIAMFQIEVWGRFDPWRLQPRS